MLHLGLAENGLYHDLQDIVINRETFSLRLLEAFLGKELSVADEHLTQLGNLLVQVVWSDLVELQTDLLVIALLFASLDQVLGSSSVHAHLQLVLILSPRVVVGDLSDGGTRVESFPSGGTSVVLSVVTTTVVVTTSATTATTPNDRN